METPPPELNEDWNLLLSLFPSGWDIQAVLTGAVERLRGFRSIADLLRTLLMQVGEGYSFRETAARARVAGLADVSDVAVMKRLRHAGGWFHWMCVCLLRERGWELPEPGHWRIRLLDGTLVKGPGPGGRSWRVHYSLVIPGLECDYVELTPTKGAKTGEVLDRFPAGAGELVIADRAFAKPPGVETLDQRGAAVLVRLNTSSLPLFTAAGERFPLLERVRQLSGPDEVGSWEVYVHGPTRRIAGRLCAIRKTEAATRRAQRKIRQKAQQGGPQTKPETLEFAAYVMVFTTLPASDFPAQVVLEWYRGRWQIELAFKRLKTLAKLGHLPDQNEETVRAWLYGKLLIALLGQKIARLGRDISPWGYRQGSLARMESMERA
jgi:hypothetical protein